MPDFGRYVEVELLGQGGMGAVYRARDPELDRAVAIKVVLNSSPELVARFRREAQAIARLQHGNIVQVYDFALDSEGNPYFVMELVEGRPLDELLLQRGRLTPLEAMRIGRQAAEGLAAAHRAGIIHRDVKPANLILDARGTIKLVDFGIARVNEGGTPLTSASALMGTPGYMAPEQAAGRRVDHRADVYALGLTLFELISGAPPFQASDPVALIVMNMQDPLPDLRSSGRELPEDLLRLIEQMGAKDPDARPQSCEVVATVLGEMAARLGGQPATQEVPTARWEGTPSAAAVATPTLPGAVGGVGASDPASRSPVSLAIAVGAAVAVIATGTAGLLYFRSAGEQASPTPMAAALPSPAPSPVPSPAPGAAAITPQPGPLRVAVLKFRNLGQDPELGSLELGIGETAVSGLGAASKEVQLIERADLESDIGELDRAKDEHFDRATMARLGKLEGIQLAIQGGFQRSGKLLRITARFVRVETGQIVDTISVTRPAKDVFGAQDAVAAELRRKLIALAAAQGTP